MKYSKYIVLLFLLFFSVVASSDCKKYQSFIDSINSRYSDKYRVIASESFESYQMMEGMPDDILFAIMGHKIEAKLREKRIMIDTPSLTMKAKKIIFGVPRTTMKIHTISFDTPKVIFVMKKTGQYPETYCKNTWIRLPFGGMKRGMPKCITRWIDIKTKVPVVHMATTVIKIKIPVLKWDDTAIILDIPEFFMERQELILKLPKVKMVAIQAKRKKEEQEKAVTAKLEAVQAEHKSALKSNLPQWYNCLRLAIETQRKNVIMAIDHAIEEIEAAVKESKKYGVDPKNIPSEGGAINLIAIKEMAVKKRQESMAEFDKALSSMASQKRDALSQFD